MLPDLLAALDKEQAEFVRPALIRALAAHGDDARVQPVLVREAGRGEDFFRSAVIEALGDYKAKYAFDALNAIAKLDGPLQDDAALALGKIGDQRALETLAGLQRTASRQAQPFVAAGSACSAPTARRTRASSSKRSSSRTRTSAFRNCCGARRQALAPLAWAGARTAHARCSTWVFRRATRPVRPLRSRSRRLRCGIRR